MTENEKKVIEASREISLLIWKCIITEDKEKRFKYGKTLFDKLQESKDNSIKLTKIFDDFINKLTEAAATIKEQNEWLDCLYTAIGDDKKEIIYAANTARKVLQNYKKKRKD